MVVKFIKYHVLFAHDVDEVCELTDSDAEKLIKSGHVVAYLGEDREPDLENENAEEVDGEAEGTIEAVENFENELEEGDQLDAEGDEPSEVSEDSEVADEPKKAKRGRKSNKE